MQIKRTLPIFKYNPSISKKNNYIKFYFNSKISIMNSNNQTNDKQTKEKPNKKDVKAAKGARDFTPYQMSLRSKVFKIIIEIFKKHGAVEIDTPVFELKETLMGKYGEESKLIYELNDQGGELLALRYDLTVPFARYMSTNNIQSIKRFHIGKVYRRDDPIMTKGRFREFYQCDLDIVGLNYGKMISDSECLKVAVEILSSINVGKFLIKLNHRKLLDAIIEIAGIDNSSFKPVCSSIDKLDKEKWEVVKDELMNKKGINEVQCNKLWEYVQLKDSPWKLYEVLVKNEDLLNNPKAKEAIEEMKTLFTYLDALEITNFFSFDLSLARGLDYYTGLIYEGILLEGKEVGSICGGGRYDDLIGMFSNKQLPAVGISIGIERIFSILEKVYKNDKSIRESDTEVLVASVGKSNLTLERMKILNELWKNDIKSEILYNEVPRLDKQNDFVSNKKIPFIIFIGENEVKEDKIKVKCLANHKEVEIMRKDMIKELSLLLSDPLLRIID